MADDPMRLRESVGEELSDLRGALRDAAKWQPSTLQLERMARRLEEELDPPSTDGGVEDAEEPPDAERPPLEPADPRHLATTAEAELTEVATEAVTADVAGGLTAGLFAAGAAMVWLRRFGSRLAPDDESSS